MNSIQPFAPSYGSTQTLTAGAASLSTPLNPRASNVRIVNAGANVAFVRIGDGAQTATTADFPVMPGQAATITKPIGSTGTNPQEMGYISALGSTLYVTTGQGA